MNNTAIRIITFLVGFLILVLVAGGVYLYFFFNNNDVSTGDNQVETSAFQRTFAPLFGGIGTEEPQTPNQATATPETFTQEFTLPDFYQVWEQPIAGAIILESTSTTMIRLVDRATGHIFDVSLNDGSETRITNTTFPQVHNAEWITPNEVVLQYIDDDDLRTVRSYRATFEYATSTDEVASISGEFLPINITDLAAHSGSLAYLSDGVLMVDGVTTFQSEITGWQLTWINDTNILLTQNASNGLNGIAYQVTVDGTSEVIIPASLELTTTSGNGFIVYSANETLVRHNIETGDELNLTTLTLPEKCILTTVDGDVICAVPSNYVKNSATLPNAWYQGVVSFNDSIRNVSDDDGFGRALYAPNMSLDLVPLDASEDGSMILYTNYSDGSAWVFSEAL